MPEPALATMPEGLSPIYGAKASANQEKRLELILQKENEGGWPAAMILNLNPFPMKIEHGLIQYIVPACKPGKDFEAKKIDTPRIYMQYRATHEVSQGVGQRDYDAKAISPIEQAMEFFSVYSTGSDTERPLGGIVVFEGTEEHLQDPRAKVRVPFIQMRGKFKLLRFREELLTALIIQARELQRMKTLEMIQMGQTYFDDPQRKNLLTDEHRTYAQFALDKRWIQTLPVWNSARSTEAPICNACGAEYVSKVGQCKCGYVADPLLAYKEAVISYDHVRMDSLTEEQWKEARGIKAKRDKARGN